MESLVWQAISGTKSTEIYPYIRRVDLMSSNSYIISSADQIAIIDPGGLDDQMNHLFEQIALLHDERPRPVVVYLTHVHADHCFELRRLDEFRDIGRITVAVQEIGAKALKSQDSNATLAGLLERQMAKIPVDVELFSRRDCDRERDQDQDKDKEAGMGSACEREIDLNNVGFAYALRSTRIHQCPGDQLESCVVHLGGGDNMEIYHVPGHSPDSVCMRLGSVLFIGDIFFAPNPGMAGAYGWSQSDLLATIQKVIWILEHQKVKVCCSGHGRSLDADKAWSALKSMHKEVASLSGLEEVSPLWARNVAAYAEDLMIELERIFTIIAGRLSYISHVLDELDEAGEAKDTESMLDMDRIDELFTDFNSFAAELHKGRRLNWELVHKAGQIVGKLEGIFENRMMGSILDRSLLTRAGRMINDYATTYRGFKPSRYVTVVDVNDLIREVLSSLTHRPYEEKAILEADSDEDYLLALKARIAHIDLFEEVEIALEEGEDLPKVRMDRDRFTDALMDIFERLVGARAKRIRIITFKEDLWVSLRIIWNGPIELLPSGRVIGFLEKTLALCGGFIQTCNSADGPVIEIEFVSADEI